jgi:hypothetical protein
VSKDREQRLDCRLRQGKSLRLRVEVLGRNVPGGHEANVVKTLLEEYGTSNSAAERMIVNWLQLESRKNRREGGRRDQGDPGCQSCCGV